MKKSFLTFLYVDFFNVDILACRHFHSVDVFNVDIFLVSTFSMSTFSNCLYCNCYTQSLDFTIIFTHYSCMKKFERPIIKLCILFKVRYVIACFNNYVQYLGLCCELLIRLSCFIHQHTVTAIFLTIVGIEPGTFRL